MPNLFPHDKEVVTIKQGQVGDCYLLASLDCILNMKGGRELLKSLFTENSDGSVTLRIKRTHLSNHLKIDKLKGQFEYIHDENRNEDVFVISQKKLLEIEKRFDEANKLLVKRLKGEV